MKEAQPLSSTPLATRICSARPSSSHLMLKGGGPVCGMFQKLTSRLSLSPSGMVPQKRTVSGKWEFIAKHLPAPASELCKVVERESQHRSNKTSNAKLSHRLVKTIRTTMCQPKLTWANSPPAQSIAEGDPLKQFLLCLA